MNIAIILASGTGSRFRSDTPKQFLKLAGKMVLEHTIEAFEHHPDIDQIILVAPHDQKQFIKEIIIKGQYKKTSKIVNGGSTRQESSASGVSAVSDDRAKVLVHDAARPLLDAATISRCIKALDHYDAVDTGIASPDTIIKIKDNNCIDLIPDRSSLRLGQTPQAFRAGLLKKAHELASSDKDLKVTDDCGIILNYDLSEVHVVEGDTSNIKITYPSDIYLADRLFQIRSNHIATSNLDLPIENKTIVVFGASRGIGKNICELASQKGANVIGVSRKDGVDIQNTKSVRETLVRAAKKFGSIDMVVNSAGILRTGLLSAYDYKEIQEQININITGSIIVSREAFEFLKENGGSIALFTSSSYTRGRAYSAVYSATKAAVVNLMQGLAEEYMPFNVRINAINPERTNTPMRTENFGVEPIETLLDADTVAKATLKALCSDNTGEVVDVRK